MCVENLRTGLNFLGQLIWGVTLGLLRKWTFPISLLGNPRNVYWNPQNKGLFFWDISIWGVTCLGLLKKWIVLPSISLKPPLMCVETLRTGLNFPRQSIWGVTCLGFLWKHEHFPISLPWKPHKCVLKPTEQGLFFRDYRFEGSHLGLL